MLLPPRSLPALTRCAPVPPLPLQPCSHHIPQCFEPAYSTSAQCSTTAGAHLVCPTRVRSSWNPSRFHSRTVLSALVVASCWQSGEMRHLRIYELCARSLCRGSKCVECEVPAGMRAVGECVHISEVSPVIDAGCCASHSTSRVPCNTDHARTTWPIRWHPTPPAPHLASCATRSRCHGCSLPLSCCHQEPLSRSAPRCLSQARARSCMHWL